MADLKGFEGYKMTIKITGCDVLIDDDMAEEILKYKWSVQSRRHGIYFAANTVGPDGEKRVVFLHRLIMGEPKGKIVDHKFGNHLDNRRENLRICDNRENSRNTKIPRTNTSGFKGVTRRGNKWEANIKFNGRHKYLGRFNSPEDAAVAYNDSAKKFFGEFYRDVNTMQGKDDE
jgi:hypothetical protein